MLVIRPITMDDLDQLYELSKLTSFGLTTLPQDRDLLRKRLVAAVRSFEELADGPRGQVYLLALEDLNAGRLAGVSGIVSKVGGFEPFYAYRIETSVHESKMLGVRKEIRTLHLVMEHSGPSEIGSLFLSPSYRGGGHGRLLSLSRFLFMAEHPALFDPLVIAEMRGIVDDKGESPFWDALGRHFFEIDYPKADYLSMVSKRFIAELMPRHPIYIPLLPKPAQEVIGKVHPETEPALAILEQEGFRFHGMVDIFEAGPVVSCPLEQIRTVRQSVRGVLAKVTQEPLGGAVHVISNVGRGFRACLGNVQVSGQEMTVSQLTALTLKLRLGDAVRVASLKPAPEAAGAAAKAVLDQPRL